MDSPEWTQFRDYASKSLTKVCLPSVVIQETIGKLSELYVESTGGIKSALRKLEALPECLGPLSGRNCKEMRNTQEASAADIASEAVAEGVVEFLQDLFGGSAQILPWPAVTHAELVRRSAMKLRPFQNKDTGYKDALIWHSILEEVHRDQDSLFVFITSNRNDFMEGDQWHKDFLDDMLRRNIEPERIAIVDSLDAFNKQYAKPILKHIEEWRSKLATDERAGFLSELEKQNDELLLFVQEYLQQVFGRSATVSMANVTVHPAFSLAVSDVLGMQNGNLYIAFSIPFLVEIPWELTSSNDETFQSQLKYLPSLRNSIWCLDAMMSAVFDPKERTIVSVSVSRIDFDYQVTGTLSVKKLPGPQTGWLLDYLPGGGADHNILMYMQQRISNLKELHLCIAELGGVQLQNSFDESQESALLRLSLVSLGFLERWGLVRAKMSAFTPDAGVIPYGSISRWFRLFRAELTKLCSDYRGPDGIDMDITGAAVRQSSGIIVHGERSYQFRLRPSLTGEGYPELEITISPGKDYRVVAKTARFGPVIEQSSLRWEWLGWSETESPFRTADPSELASICFHWFLSDTKKDDTASDKDSQ